MTIGGGRVRLAGSESESDEGETRETDDGRKCGEKTGEGSATDENESEGGPEIATVTGIVREGDAKATFEDAEAGLAKDEESESGLEKRNEKGKGEDLVQGEDHVRERSEDRVPERGEDLVKREDRDQDGVDLDPGKDQRNEDLGSDDMGPVRNEKREKRNESRRRNQAL